MRAWYALSIKTNHEQVIQESPYASGVEFFHPKYSEEVRRGNRGYRRETVERPLFPGYLFARFDALESAAAIRSISGVFEIVSFGDEPAAIPDDQIEAIRVLLRSGRTVVPLSNTHIQPGDVVELLYGAFQGFEGEVLKLKGRKDYALFVVSIRGMEKTCAIVPTTQIRLAKRSNVVEMKKPATAALAKAA